MLRLLFFIILGFNSFIGYSQTIGDLRPIIGLTYGTEPQVFGITGGVEYLLLDDFAIAPTYEYYFDGPDVLYNSINADFRYYFKPGQLSFYGLIGYSQNITDSNRELKVSKGGVNIGTGTVYRFMFFDRIAAFGQVKYSTANKSQFSAMGGITYFFNIL